jgi:hypothetical protein
MERGVTRLSHWHSETPSRLNLAHGLEMVNTNLPNRLLPSSLDPVNSVTVLLTGV